MSFTLMAKAKPIKVGNSGRKLVLMMLADISDDSGRCFPSYQHLADVCEMSRRSVITHMLSLQESGFLTITHRKLKGEMLNSSNVYQLTLESAAKPDETCGENSALGGEIISLGSENSALGSETVALGGSENSAPITYHSSYPIKEPIKEPKTDIDFGYLTASEFRELTEIRIANHKAKKAKAPVMTQRIANTLINQISLAITANYSIDDVLNEFATRGWLSIKADWLTSTPSNRNSEIVINQPKQLTEKQALRKQITANVLDVSNTDW